LVLIVLRHSHFNVILKYYIKNIVSIAGKTCRYYTTLEDIVMFRGSGVLLSVNYHLLQKKQMIFGSLISEIEHVINTALKLVQMVLCT